MPDIFGGEDNPHAAIRAEDLVGEGKKFKSVDDLAKGKAEADAYIERLKAEVAERDSRLAQTVNAEAELAKIREEIAAARQVPKQEVQPDRPRQPEKDIDAIVEESITRAETRRSQAQNIREANKLMVDQFGDPTKAGAEVAKRATELDMSVEDLRGLAARSPSAFKRLMLGDNPTDPSRTVDLTRSTVSPLGVIEPVRSGAQGTKEHFQEVLRKNPRAYMDPKTQAAILKATIEGTYVP